MKKIVVLLAVVALAAPLYAQDDVIIKMRTLYDPNPAGNWLVEVSYDSSGASQLVRGFSFDILLDDETVSPYVRANFTKLEGYKEDVFSTEAAPGYGVYLGSITFKGPGDPCMIEFSGSPQAQYPDAYPGVGTSESTWELASLYDPCDFEAKKHAPLNTGVLASFRVDKDCSVKIVADTDTRGGFVMEDGSQGTLKFMSDTFPQDKYYRVSWGFLGFCNGDGTGDDWVNTADFFLIRDSFLKNYASDWNGGAGPYNPAADFTMDGFINTADFFKIRDSFLATPIHNCTVKPWPPGS